MVGKDHKALRTDSIISNVNGNQEPSSHSQNDRGGDEFDLHNTHNTPPPMADSEKGSGMSGAVFNLATTVIGAGIMALPATMKVLGLIAGVVFIFLMGVLSEISLELLVRFTHQCKATSYGEVVEHALGKPARIVSEVFIVLNNAGVLLVYLIIMGDVMSGSPRHEGVLEQWFGNGFWDDRRIVSLILLIVFLAPLCSLSKIDSLSLTSGVSVVLAIMFVVIAVVVTSMMLANGEIDSPRLIPDFGSKAAILDLLVVIPIMSNAYVCHFNVQPIYNELDERTPEKMNMVGRWTTVICIFIYWSTAVAGYLLFGKETEPDVLTNFDKPLPVKGSEMLNYLVRVGYICHLILVFPVIHFSLRQTVDALAFSGKPPLSKSKTRCLGLTVAILAVVYSASVLIPSIWTAFKFTGATTAVSLGFVFPSLIALRLSRHGPEGLSSRERVLSWLMLILAIIVSIVGIVGNIYGLKN